MAVKNLNHVGVWHARGPSYGVFLLLVGDEKRGFILTYTVVYLDRKDGKIIRVPDGATTQQVIALADGMFDEVRSGKTPLGGPWGELTRIIVNGSREELLEAVRAKGIEIGGLFN